MAANKNALLLSTLTTEAETLACSVSQNRFPILLKPIAERRRVTSVEFRPLLVDAILTTHPSGFRILFNSEGADPAKLTMTFESESESRLLGARQRFSLAHELAHTLFFDLSEPMPTIRKEFRSGGGKTALENLERACNVLASHFLLPTALLKAELLRMKATDAQSIHELAHKAGVSIEALIRRIGENSSLLVNCDFRGCVVLIKDDGKSPAIAAVAKPQHTAIADDLRLLRGGEKWQLRESSGLFLQPERLLSGCTVQLRTSTQFATSLKKYHVSSVEARTNHAARLILSTFEEVECS